MLTLPTRIEIGHQDLAEETENSDAAAPKTMSVKTRVALALPERADHREADATGVCPVVVREAIADVFCNPSTALVQPIRKGNEKLLAIRLPTDVEKRLAALAEATGRTKTFYAREAILEHLDVLEDLHLAEQRLAEIRAGRVRTIPLEDVMKDYDMED